MLVCVNVAVRVAVVVLESIAVAVRVAVGVRVGVFVVAGGAPDGGTTTRVIDEPGKVAVNPLGPTA